MLNKRLRFILSMNHARSRLNRHGAAVRADLTVTAFDTPRRFIKFRVLNERQQGITRAICLFASWHDCPCKLARASTPHLASNSRSDDSGRN